MLANTMLQTLQQKHPTQDLMAKDTFFSYLLDRAKEDREPLSRAYLLSHSNPQDLGVQTQGSEIKMTNQFDATRKITAYPLVDHVAPLQAATEARAWGAADEAVYTSLELTSANRQGWVLHCPFAFTATWHGGSAPQDIEIHLDADALEANADGGDFVQSQLGAGLLTFYPGYQFKIDGEHLLWVRGPINAPKDGLSALESLVDASVLPYTVTIHWQFTRPTRPFALPLASRSPRSCPMSKVRKKQRPST